MRVFRTVQEIDLPWGSPIGFVPTMGAFHEGHLALMRAARARCGYCVVSLFVNPTQFGPAEDFAKYPRDENRDFLLAESAGVNAIFAPDVHEMYGNSHTTVRVGQVANRWEGELRPGHFEGVATVVAKLFNMVRPTEATFGLKDYQQCAVVSQMVRDLAFPLSLNLVDTVREPDGLAMSSRNRYLSPQDRKRAPALYASLLETARRLRCGELGALAEARRELERQGFQVQYLDAVDSSTLEPINSYDPSGRLIVAAILGGTRLIDNIALDTSMS